MAAIYAVLIINGRKTFDQVRDNLKEAVRAKINELGYGIDGNPIS